MTDEPSETPSHSMTTGDSEREPETAAARPRASPEQEKLARDIFPLHMSPGEYCARHGGSEACFGYENYRYRDERLDRWVQTVARICRTPGLLERVRQRYLEHSRRDRERDETD